jgi:hypothetical protein
MVSGDGPATSSILAVASIAGNISDAPTPMPTMPSFNLRPPDGAVFVASAIALPISRNQTPAT